jgi:hypothetical protein
MKEAMELFGFVRKSATRRARHWDVQFDVGQVCSRFSGRVVADEARQREDGLHEVLAPKPKAEWVKRAGHPLGGAVNKRRPVTILIKSRAVGIWPAPRYGWLVGSFGMFS